MILGLMRSRVRRGSWHRTSRTCGIVALCAVANSATAADMAPLGAFRVDVPARGFQEHCVRLEAGQRVRYRFSASGEVDFNLHYHQGKDVFYPVRSVATRAADGVYVAPHGDGYCLMWERRGDGVVQVDGAIEQEPAPAPSR